MPYSETQRRAAFAELRRRKSGGKSRIYRGMSTGDLDEYAHAPLKKRKSKTSAADQGRALRGGE